MYQNINPEINKLNIDNALLFNVLKKAFQNFEVKSGDYKGKNDLWYCGKCNTPKQSIHIINGENIIIPCNCRCQEEAYEAEKREKEKQKSEERIKYLQSRGLTDTAYLMNTLANDDGRNKEATQIVKKYLENWETHKAECNGIIFYGDTGGGKSFYACCIANELINKGVPVLVSRLSDLVNDKLDKSKPNIDFSEFALVVLDDVGVENATATAYTIIDDIYRKRIPLIITTNLNLSDLKEPKTIDEQRIYERIIQRCCPISQKVDVKISRLDMARKKHKELKSRDLI